MSRALSPNPVETAFRNRSQAARVWLGHNHDQAVVTTKQACKVVNEAKHEKARLMTMSMAWNLFPRLMC